ncbi:MAG: hypothetical protein IMZ53_13085 [Thermoplasmata archaeon]|nr:hypothetical protein [Thermoplasmata archaeon]
MKIERVKNCAGEFTKTIPESPEDEKTLEARLKESQKIMLKQLRARALSPVGLTGIYSDIKPT